jgi:hypothetical protein
MTVQNAFAIVEITSPTTHLSTFASGAEAGKVAAGLNSIARLNNLAFRYRVIGLKSPASNEDWKTRETQRFVSGTYNPVPWSGEPWANPDHFAHVSKNNPAKLAFTPSAEFGLADRQLRMRPGRYLTKYFSSVLTPDEIKTWCSKYTAQNGATVLRFATTPDEIQAVYENGPNSCMAHKAADFESPEHPTRVYGAGDLAIAWVLGADGTDCTEGTDETETSAAFPHVAARALCWPAKKIYGRIYGDETLLTQLFDEAGFTESYDSWDWNGARLFRIETTSGDLVAPYLDDPNCNVTARGKFLILDDSGEIQCRNTSGVAEQGEICAHCEDRTTGDTFTVDGETWCDYCYENHSFYCEDCNESCGGEPELHDHAGNAICTSCASSYAQCESCNEWHHSDDLTYSEADHADYCQTCADDMQRSACGEPTTDPASCYCHICKAARDVANFELKAQSQTGELVPFIRPAPVFLKPTSPTIRDARQGELQFVTAYIFSGAGSLLCSTI